MIKISYTVTCYILYSHLQYVREEGGEGETVRHVTPGSVAMNLEMTQVKK